MADIVGKIVKAAREAVDKLFLRASVRLGLTKTPEGARRITVSVDPTYTIPGLHIASAKEFGVTLRPRVIEHVRRIASDYLNGQKEAAKAAVGRTIEGILRHAGDDYRPAVKKELTDALGRITEKLSGSVERIAATEATAARNLGLLEAIGQMNAEAGVEDPVIFAIIVRDGLACKECVTLHMLPDKKTPRVWLRSECESGYHDPGSGRPSVLGEHPHCRCVWSTLLPGYGFDDAGFVKYIAPGYREIDVQRRG